MQMCERVKALPQRIVRFMAFTHSHICGANAP